MHKSCDFILKLSGRLAGPNNGASEYFSTADRRTAATANFERPFTPRTSLRSPRNFGNARFRRFANFDLLTSKDFFRNIFWIFVVGFSLFSADFRGAKLFLTSKSRSSSFFALDGQIFRSVQRLELIFGFFTIRTSTCGEIYREGPGAPTRQQQTEPGPPTSVFLVAEQD